MPMSPEDDLYERLQRAYRERDAARATVTRLSASLTAARDALTQARTHLERTEATA